MKLKMKKFFAALGALAIVGMVAVGCEGKQPKVEDSITVKQSGKDVTALSMSVGDKVTITTNAASAADGALVVVAKPAGFTVTSSDQNIVAASNTALEAKAAGTAKVTFTAGKAKVEVAVTVKKGEDVTFDPKNFLGKEIYIPSDKKFEMMKDWKAELLKAYGSINWEFTAYNDDKNSERTYLFVAKDGVQSVLGRVTFVHNPTSGPKFISAEAGYQLGFWKKDTQKKLLDLFGFVDNQKLDAKLKDETPAAGGENKARGLDALMFMKKQTAQNGQEYEHVTLQISELQSQSATTLSKRMAYNMPYKL
jgi:putative lipoprotein